MSVTLSQSKLALAPNLTASFLAAGGTAPYVYAVFPGGAGGTIDPSSGIYTAPTGVSVDPQKNSDVVSATDFNGLIGYAKISVGNPLLLFCDILRRGMEISEDRVFLWDQKNFQPTDEGVYIPLSVLSCRAFSNTINPGVVAGVTDWSQAVHACNIYSVLEINAISRDISALYRKEEIPLVLNGLYSQQQQEGNSFYIGKIPTQWTDISQIDGAAIPYRFSIQIAIQYMVTKTVAAQYIDDFSAGVQPNFNP
jgi:hypothetical protein